MKKKKVPTPPNHKQIPPSCVLMEDKNYKQQHKFFHALMLDLHQNRLSKKPWKKPEREIPCAADERILEKYEAQLW